MACFVFCLISSVYVSSRARLLAHLSFSAFTMLSRAACDLYILGLFSLMDVDWCCKLRKLAERNPNDTLDQQDVHCMPNSVSS